MRRLLAASVLTWLPCVLAACSTSSGSGAADAGTSPGDDASSGVTCYDLVSAGTVSVPAADACRVLGSGHSGVALPGKAPAGLVVSKVCSELCIGVHGDNFCVVAPGFANAYTQANDPGASDGGAEAGPTEAGATICPATDAGGVTITCYAEMPYQATACPQ